MFDLSLSLWSGYPAQERRARGGDQEADPLGGHRRGPDTQHGKGK